MIEKRNLYDHTTRREYIKATKAFSMRRQEVDDDLAPPLSVAAFMPKSKKCPIQP